jgi:phage baseplate assembly protein W
MASRPGRAGADAQATNLSDKSSRIYKDLDLFFGKRGTDSDVNKVEDIQAVKRSVRNLVLLNEHEKPFHPEIHSGVRDMLFENMTPVVSNILARKIEDVITNFEPRARLQTVRAIPNFDKNAYEVSIEFFVVNTPTELVDMSIMLERIR